MNETIIGMITKQELFNVIGYFGQLRKDVKEIIHILLKYGTIISDDLTDRIKIDLEYKNAKIEIGSLKSETSVRVRVEFDAKKWERSYINHGAFDGSFEDTSCYVYFRNEYNLLISLSTIVDFRNEPEKFKKDKMIVGAGITQKIRKKELEKEISEKKKELESIINK